MNDTQKARIMVVDDQAGVRLTLKGILSKKGYEVEVAEDGVQALALLQQKPFHLVLMDVIMPHMSGVETFLRMKQLRPDLLVMLMTAYAVQEDVRRALREGAYAVVYKPFDMDRLFPLLEEGLSRRPLVLVVDGSVQDRRLAKNQLLAKGYGVLEVENMDDCLKQIEERHFQVVLLDATTAGLPEGINFLKQIKLWQPEVAIILIANPGGDRALAQTLPLEAVARVQKPFEVETLLRLLKHYLPGFSREKE